MANQQPIYPVYRGLQKPLVFKSFRGRYIYWGLATILIALLAAMVVSSMVNILSGIVTMIFILGTGLGITAYYQQHGTKSRKKVIAIIPNHPIINHEHHLK